MRQRLLAFSLQSYRAELLLRRRRRLLLPLGGLGLLLLPLALLPLALLLLLLLVLSPFEQDVLPPLLPLPLLLLGLPLLLLPLRRLLLHVGHERGHGDLSLPRLRLPRIRLDVRRRKLLRLGPLQRLQEPLVLPVLRAREKGECESNSASDTMAPPAFRSLEVLSAGNFPRERTHLVNRVRLGVPSSLARLGGMRALLVRRKGHRSHESLALLRHVGVAMEGLVKPTQGLGVPEPNVAPGAVGIPVWGRGASERARWKCGWVGRSVNDSVRRGLPCGLTGGAGRPWQRRTPPLVASLASTASKCNLPRARPRAPASESSPPTARAGASSPGP